MKKSNIENTINSSSFSNNLTLTNTNNHNNSLYDSNGNPLTLTLINSFMDTTKEKYNPFKAKASILEAQKYEATSNHGPVVLKEGKGVICPSNLKPVRKSYPFWTWSWNLISQGAIIPSYFNFRTQLFVITLMLTLQAGFSLHGMSQLYCEANFTDPNTQEELCSNSWEKYYLYTDSMFTYKRYDEVNPAYVEILIVDMQVWSWVSLLLLCFCRSYFHIGQEFFEDGYEARRSKLRLENREDNCEDYNYRPQDYTVLVGDVNINTTEKEIEEFIKSKQDDIGRIVKVVKATPLTPYKLYEIEARKQEGMLDKLDEFLEGEQILEPETFQYLKRKKEHLQKSIQNLIRKRRSKKNEIKPGKEDHCIALVTFENFLDKEKVLLDRSDRSCSSCMWCCKQKNDKMIIHRAPSAQDIIWKNVGWSNRQRCLANWILIVTHATIAIVISSLALGLFYFKYLPFFNQKTGFWVHFVESTAPSLILFILCYIMKKAIRKTVELNFSLTRSANVYWTVQLAAMFKAISFLVLTYKTYISYNKGDFKGEDAARRITLIALNYLLMRLVLEPLSTLVTFSDVYYYLKKATIQLKSWMRKGTGSDKVLKTQEELNAIFEKKELRIGESIGKLTYLFNIVAFLSFLYPLGVFIYLIYIIIQSTVEKWVMIRRYQPPKFQYSRRYGRDIAKILHDCTAVYIAVQMSLTAQLFAIEIYYIKHSNFAAKVVAQFVLWILCLRTTHFEMSFKYGDDNLDGSKKKLQKLIESHSLDSFAGYEELTIKNTADNRTKNSGSGERRETRGDENGLNTSSDDDFEGGKVKYGVEDVTRIGRRGRGSEGYGMSDEESDDDGDDVGMGNRESERLQSFDNNRRLNEFSQGATPNLKSLKSYTEAEALFSQDYEVLNPVNDENSFVE